MSWACPSSLACFCRDKSQAGRRGRRTKLLFLVGGKKIFPALSFVTGPRRDRRAFIFRDGQKLHQRENLIPGPHKKWGQKRQILTLFNFEISLSSPSQFAKVKYDIWHQEKTYTALTTRVRFRSTLPKKSLHKVKILICVSKWIGSLSVFGFAHLWLRLLRSVQLSSVRIRSATSD